MSTLHWQVPLVKVKRRGPGGISVRRSLDALEGGREVSLHPPRRKPSGGRWSGVVQARGPEGGRDPGDGCPSGLQEAADVREAALAAVP